ncbi:MAG: phage holin family protein [Nitrospira sp.]|nr:phage holin family protein [Nitrospira sp.]
METTQQGYDASRPPDASTPSGVLQLLQGIVTDIRRLIGQQVQLAIHELQLEGARAVGIVLTAITGGILGALCLLFVLLTAVAALHEIVGLAVWMSCGAVALFLMVVAGGLLLYLKGQLQRLRVVPVRTLHTVKEDAQWIKEWIASSKT